MAAQLRAIVDKLLTNVSIMIQAQGCVAETLLPSLPVDQQSGLLAKYLNQHLRIVRSQMGGVSQAPTVWPIQRDKTTTYYVEPHGLNTILTEEDYANVESPFQVEQDAVAGLTSSILLEKESVLASKLTDTTVLTQNTTLVGTSQFNDYVNSDPISQFVTAVTTVRNACGYPPNVAIMDWYVAQKLRFHPQLYDRLGFKYNQMQALTDQQLAMAMGIDKVVIPQPVYNNSTEGQSDSLTPVWGKHIVFGVIPASAQLRQMSLGYYLYMRSMPKRAVFRYPVYNPPNAQGFIVRDSYQFNITFPQAGYLIVNAVA